MKSRKAVAERIRSRLNFTVKRPLRDQLLARALQEQEQSWKTEPALSEPTPRRMIMRIPITRIAIAALIGTSVVTAAVVSVQHKYRFLETREGGRQVVVREDGRSSRSWDFSPKTANTPQQAVETAEELDGLMQQGKKVLMGAQETEVNGQLDNRVLEYRYTLSDGRTVTQFEADPETGPGTLSKERKQEADRLLREAMGYVMSVQASDGSDVLFTAQGKEIVTYERVLQGRTIAFKKYTVTLSDGTQVSRSIGHLSESPRTATAQNGSAKGAYSREELREWMSLRHQDKRQLIALDELTANGRLDRRVSVYRYQLSNGRTMDMREGDEGTTMPVLNPAQRQEWVQARDAKSGQDLGTSEEQVKGRTFIFTRQRFVLSDGTELIWSVGKPKDNQ